jgi:hypothetical protein
MKIYLHSTKPKDGFLGLGLYGSVDAAHNRHSDSKKAIELPHEDVLVVDPISKGFASSFVCNAIPDTFEEVCPSFELLVKNKSNGEETIFSVVYEPRVKVSDKELSDLRCEILEKNGLTTHVDCSMNFYDALVDLYHTDTLDETEEEAKIDLHAFVEKFALGDFEIAMLKLEGELQNALQEKYDVPTYGLADFVVDSTALLDVAKANGYSAVRLIADDLDVVALDPERV